jgi:hypothetical protein
VVVALAENHMGVWCDFTMAIASDKYPSCCQQFAPGKESTIRLFLLKIIVLKKYYIPTRIVIMTLLMILLLLQRGGRKRKSKTKL